MISKKELREKFSKKFEKYYPIEFFEKHGFKRYKCKKCGSYFWSLKERETCADISCIEKYQFIGEKIKEINYHEVWDEFKKFFESKGHKAINKYPVVCRWRNDLYFTIASIVDFQRYTEDKLVFEYPYDKLVVPQTCLRFNDIENVGITGRHFTSFQMNGQHAFGYPKTGYWKNECLEYIFEFLTKYLPKEELVFKEDVWAMPDFSAFGPCIECFYKGLEIVNSVFIEFTYKDGRIKELDQKVIDVGWGHERLVWVLNGSLTSYEAVFGPIFKKYMNFEYDKEFMKIFGKYCGILDVDDENYEENLNVLSKHLDLSLEEIKEKIGKFAAYCSILDHLRTFSYALSDYLFPSNVGGGYNIRLILRRVFYFNEKYEFNFDLLKLCKDICFFFKINFDEEIFSKILNLEYTKYKETIERGEREILNKIKKNPKFSLDELKVFYESKGISPEMILEIAERNNLKVILPENYYSIFNRDVVKKQKEEFKLDYETEILYYSDVFEFEAKILDTIEKNGKIYVVLDKSAFYPEMGGEKSDTGKIEEANVFNVIKIGKTILHEVDKKLEKGLKVRCVVDKERRFRKNCNHTGVHILNGACKKILGKHVWQNGSEVDTVKARLDITHYELPTKEQIEKIEKLCNEIISQKINVVIEEIERKEAEKKYGFGIYQGGAVPLSNLRIIKIDDHDIEACGGNHVKNTEELQYLKIIGVEKIHDGVIRFTITTGKSCIELLSNAYEELKKVKSKYNVEDLDKYISSLIEKNKELKKEIERLKKELSKKYLDGNIQYIEGVDAKTLKNIALELKKKYPNGFLMTEGIVCGFGEKFKPYIEKAAEMIGGRAGGRDLIFGGGPKKELSKKVFDEIKKELEKL